MDMIWKDHIAADRPPVGLPPPIAQERMGMWAGENRSPFLGADRQKNEIVPVMDLCDRKVCGAAPTGVVFHRHPIP